MHLAPVLVCWRHGSRTWCRGLPVDATGVRIPILHGGELQSVSRGSSPAARVCGSGLHGPCSVADDPGSRATRRSRSRLAQSSTSRTNCCACGSERWLTSQKCGIDAMGCNEYTGWGGRYRTAWTWLQCGGGRWVILLLGAPRVGVLSRAQGHPRQWRSSPYGDALGPPRGLEA